MEYNYIMPTRDKYYKGMLDESDSKSQEPKNITYTNQNFRNNNKYAENHNRSTSNKTNIDLPVSYKNDQNNIMNNSNKIKNKIKDEEHKEPHTLNISSKKNSAHIQDEQEIKIVNKNKTHTHNLSTNGYRNMSKPTNKSLNHNMNNNNNNNVQDNNYLSVKEKGIQSEKKRTSISRSVTPNKSGKNGSISSKIKNDNTMTYLTYEDIQNFEFELSVD
ncbi:conserved Plasmodium protein, unknown function, partial [Plasmodium ovale curtisi]